MEGRLRLLVVLGLMLAACGDGFTVAEPVSTQSEATGTCPANIPAANGERCAQNGLECRMPITCDAVNEQVKCLCTNGLFECSDHFGPIPIGGDPTCTPRGPADDSACPPTMAVAAGLACETTGKLCSYEGPICPESLTGKPVLEACVCRGLSNGTKHYVCYPHRCLGN
jgi:hypothetical protein